MFVGEVIVYATGIPWLMGALHVPLQRGLVLGLAPFVPGDVLKLLIAAGLLPLAWGVHFGARQTKVRAALSTGQSRSGGV